MPGRTFTAANQITILRLIFAPLFAMLAIDHRYEGALAVLILAAASDVIDGFVARAFHQQSSLGVALDPIADKILMTTAYLVLSFLGVLPWWLTCLVLCRDAGIVVTAALISVVAGYRPFPPTLAGKASTVAQVAAVLAAVGYRAHVFIVSQPMVVFFIYLAGFLTVVSGIHYLIIGRQRFDPRPEDPAGQS
ncbi:MAG: CDP-alcohol phosphatidyltransferase family protein [Acidobacteriota bacterium]|nr:CDP-alcohol phosphatidyltransferase family protein [Acidobacteriota bacterium]